MDKKVNFSPAARTFMALWHPWGRLLALGLTVGLLALADAFPVFPGDRWAWTRIQALQADWLTAAATVLSCIGRPPVAAGLFAAGVGALAIFRRWDAVALALAAALFVLAAIGIKELVDRPRPPEFPGLAENAMTSFPSGNTVFAAIFLGLAVMLARQWIPWPAARYCCITALTLLALAVGAARVYLGFHWPSDVLGAYWYAAVALAEINWLRLYLSQHQGQSHCG